MNGYQQNGRTEGEDNLRVGISPQEVQLRRLYLVGQGLEHLDLQLFATQALDFFHSRQQLFDAVIEISRPVCELLAGVAGQPVQSHQQRYQNRQAIRKRTLGPRTAWPCGAAWPAAAERTG